MPAPVCEILGVDLDYFLMLLKHREVVVTELIRNAENKLRGAARRSKCDDLHLELDYIDALKSRIKISQNK